MSDLLKKKAADRALDLIANQMTVGLGTGSTVNFFIDGLIEKKLNIKVVASSHQSEKRAKEGSLSVLNINDVSSIDIVVDGADEIDPQKRMIKGAGGAFVREKILAKNGKKMVVIADGSKMVRHLGKRPLPVEVSVFGYKFTKNTLEKMGLKSTLRLKDGKPFESDNHNYILDLHLTSIKSLEKLESLLLEIPGVVDTGFFLNFNPTLIIAHSLAEVEIVE